MMMMERPVRRPPTLFNDSSQTPRISSPSDHQPARRAPPLFPVSFNLRSIFLDNPGNVQMAAALQPLHTEHPEFLGLLRLPSVRLKKGKVDPVEHSEQDDDGG